MPDVELNSIDPMEIENALCNLGRTSSAYVNVVSAAFICIESKVLLARRANDKRIAPGLLHLVGGHREANETPQAALSRELMEELAIRALVGDLLHVFEYGEANQKTLGFVFAVTLLDPPSQIQVDPRDTSELIWATKEQLSDLFPDKSDHNYVAVLKGLSWQGEA